MPYPTAACSDDDLVSWDDVVGNLAASRPVWEPGTAHGYHAVTYGFLVGEVLRRVTGRSVGTLLAEELAGPLGLDVLIGATGSSGCTGSRHGRRRRLGCQLAPPCWLPCTPS